MSRNEYADEIRSLEHIFSDTINKLHANEPGSEQSKAYLAMTAAHLRSFADKYFGGLELTSGQYKRMVLGEWSDDP